MVDDELIDYIKNQKKRGLSDLEIKKVLKDFNWNDNDIENAFSNINSFNNINIDKLDLNNKKNNEINYSKYFKENNYFKKKNLIFGLIILLLIGIIFGFYIYNKPPKAFCGNGIIDQGEDYFNCCIDVPCPGDSKCVNDICVDPICGDCQYLQNNICLDYECCTHDQCDNLFCVDNSCVNITCGDCQYLDEILLECVSFACCEDSDCGTGICVNAFSKEARCQQPKKYSLGENITLFNGENLRFDYKNNSEVLELISSGEDSLFRISGIVFELSLGEKKVLDINSNDENDLVFLIHSFSDSGVRMNVDKVICNKDLDCNDGNNNTIDVCNNPGLFNSKCENNVKECEIDEDCYDFKFSTKNVCYQYKCYFIEIKECIDDDWYCPTGCFNDTDNDCDYANECSKDIDCDDGNQTTVNYCDVENNRCLIE